MRSARVRVRRRPHPSNDLRRTCVGRCTVAGQDPSRVQVSEPVETAQGLRLVVGEGGGLRTGSSGEDMARGECVPDHDGIE